MNVAPLRKDEFAMDPQADPILPAAAPAAPRRAFAWPEALRLPTGRVAFDAAWPPVVGVVGFLLLWALLAPDGEDLARVRCRGRATCGTPSAG
jgi:nitrate/nitrite transport system permease protein